MDEEESLYQELQGRGGTDVALIKMQQRQDEHKTRIHAALKALLSEDLDRIQRWSSDIAALLFTVDGLEGHVRPSAKTGAKKSKGASPANIASSAGERLSELQVQLLDDFNALKEQLENSDKIQLSFEQTFRGVHDGADAAVVAMGLDSSILDAEQEVEWLGQHIARAKGLSLEPTVELLGRSEAAVNSLLCNAPPGLIPPNAEECLRDTQRQISELCQRLGEQAQALTDLQDGGECRIRALQAVHSQHRQELHRRAIDELQRCTKAFEQPMEQMRGSLRHQSEAIGRARVFASGALEELSALARRAAISSDGASPGGGGAAESGGNEALMGGIREVRGLGKILINGLEEGAKALEHRMDKVFAALVGDDPNTSTGSLRGRPAGAATATAGVPESSSPEGKKKRGKKKGPPQSSQQSFRQAAESRTAAEAPPASPAAQPSPAAEPAASPRDSVAREPRTRGVVSGKELQNEMHALKGESEALEARMAERRKVKTNPDASHTAPAEDGAQTGAADEAELAELEALAEETSSRPAPKARRKKMFV